MKLICYSFERRKDLELQKPRNIGKLLNFLKKNRPLKKISFPVWWISYNSSRNFIFSFMIQIFFKSILGTTGYKHNSLSRVFLLKSRMEISIHKRIFTKKLIRFENFGEKKGYACFNSLQFVPTFKPTYFKVSIVLSTKKIFLTKILQNISKKFNISLKKTDLSFYKISTLFNRIKTENPSQRGVCLNSFQIKRINFFSESFSRIKALIGIISYQRSLYSDKILTFFLKTGFSRINSFSDFKVLTKYQIEKVHQKKKNWKKKCYDWIEPFFANFFRYGNKNSFCISLKKISFFEILPSKNKIPLRIILKISKKFQIFNNLLFSTKLSQKCSRKLKATQKKIISKIGKERNGFTNEIKIYQLKKEFIANLPIITKESFDFHHEQIGTLYLSQFEKIFREEQTDIWLNPFFVACSDPMSGFLEMIPNSNSLHSINQNNKKGNGTYRKNKQEVFDSKTKKKRIKMLTESLAGYSLVCFILQVKDRHNGNILLNRENRVIHIDFGFIFEFSPGNLKFEANSFKMSREFISWLGGKKTEIFETLRETFIRGFFSIRKHLGKFLEIARILITEKKGNRYKIRKFQQRFKIGKPDSAVIKFCISLFKESLESWKTLQYDKYQNITSGIK